MPFSIARKLADAAPTMRDDLIQRLDALRQSLAEADPAATLRDDSRLAYVWAARETDLTRADVVQEILRMHRLFTTTDYAVVSRRVVDHVVEDLLKRHPEIDRKAALVLATRHMVPAVKALYANLAVQEAASVGA